MEVMNNNNFLFTYEEFEAQFKYEELKKEYKDEKAVTFKQFLMLKLNLHTQAELFKLNHKVTQDTKIYYASEIIEAIEKYAKQYANETSIAKVFGSNEMRTYHIARKNTGKKEKPSGDEKKKEKKDKFSAKEGKNQFQLSITVAETEAVAKTLKKVSGEKNELDCNLSPIQDAIMVMLENLVIENNLISENGRQTESVTLTHADYCKIRGKEPSKRTREDFKNNCIAMMCTSALWTDSNNVRAPIHIFSDEIKKENGKISKYDTCFHKGKFTAKFSDRFMQFMLSGRQKADGLVMKFPTEIFKINLKKYDFAISIYYNMVYFIKLNNNICTNKIGTLVGDYINAFTTNRHESRAMQKVFDNFSILKEYGVNLQYIIDGEKFESITQELIDKYNLNKWENVKEIFVEYSIDGLTYTGKKRIFLGASEQKSDEK